jgi:long-chain acyl-CoA synthetase
VTTTADPTTEVPPDVKTIADLPFHVMGRFPKPLLVGRSRGGEIQGLSSKEFFEQIRDVSLGLSALGMRAGDRVALVSESRPEWLLTDLAVLSAGAVLVPIYPTLSAAQARYILQDSGARLVVVSTRLQLDKVQEVRHLLPSLEAVIVMDDTAPPAATPVATPGARSFDSAAGSEAGSTSASIAASVFSLADVAARGHARMAEQWGAGREFQAAARAVTPEQLATIIYTSGTTGEPKGVMLTHGNLASNIHGGAAVLDVGHEDTALSFLPLSHAFERTVVYIYLLTGVTVIFAESFETVGRDISLVRPTIMTGVPRAYEKMQARILEKAQAASPVKAALFRWALRAGLARARATLRGQVPGPVVSLQAAIADRLVFSKIRAGVGGRLRYVVSGSAPLPVDVAEFFEAMGLRVIEGYGLTETAPILTVNPPAAPRVGTVGRTLPGVDVRIAADGEILARGPNIMPGYYNKPDATGAVLKDGWFHTGDIGTLDESGYLTITDRKKDLLVTSGGKKIAPQPIEAILKRSPLVGEAILLGDRRKYPAVLIVPDFARLERRLEDLGKPPGERADLVTRPDVVAVYQEIVDALNRDLSQFERIKRVALLPSEFSVETGELTPTLKVKRKVVEERWKETIEKLYAE